jgi:hypothetical protein
MNHGDGRKGLGAAPARSNWRMEPTPASTAPGSVSDTGTGSRAASLRHCHGVCKGGAFGASTRRATAWRGSYAIR